jgi:predicted restriction endonuclease
MKRESAVAAREVFERLLPVPGERSVAVRLLVDTIRAAHEAGPSSWVVTLFDDYVRLNVGPVEVITVLAGALRVLLPREADWRTIGTVSSALSDENVYKTMKGTRIAVFDAAHLNALDPSIPGLLAKSARIAASARQRTSWGDAYSDGVVAYLESEIAESLPRPGFVDSSRIDAYMFQQQLAAFLRFVSAKSGGRFGSFVASPYLSHQEGYKDVVYQAARRALQFEVWKPADVGTGSIIKRVIEAIEIPDNNLVPWQGRWGERARPHQPLFDAADPAERLRIERCLFSLFREDDDRARFEELLAIFGRTYRLISYLFFLKDPSKYLPVAPEKFDEALEAIGCDLKTSHRCSWDNYSEFLAIIEDLRAMLLESLGGEVRLLDAHSFLWVLVNQMRTEGQVVDLQEYLDLSATEREAITKARIGQGRFRRDLLRYWGSRCAVIDCTIEDLLSASHIKPWTDSAPAERIYVYNGLLLSPALDTCFDRGYVSFDDDGRILLSPRIHEDEFRELGIHPHMKLRHVDDEHRPFLAYHREYVFSRSGAVLGQSS